MYILIVSSAILAWPHATGLSSSCIYHKNEQLSKNLRGSKTDEKPSVKKKWVETILG